jgi:hypothetical protein
MAVKLRWFYFLILLSCSGLIQAQDDDWDVWGNKFNLSGKEFEEGLLRELGELMKDGSLKDLTRKRAAALIQFLYTKELQDQTLIFQRSFFLELADLLPNYLTGDFSTYIYQAAANEEWGLNFIFGKLKNSLSLNLAGIEKLKMGFKSMLDEAQGDELLLQILEVKDALIYEGKMTQLMEEIETPFQAEFQQIDQLNLGLSGFVRGKSASTQGYWSWQQRENPYLAFYAIAKLENAYPVDYKPPSQLTAEHARAYQELLWLMMAWARGDEVTKNGLMALKEKTFLSIWKTYPLELKAKMGEVWERVNDSEIHSLYFSFKQARLANTDKPYQKVYENSAWMIPDAFVAKHQSEIVKILTSESGGLTISSDCLRFLR